MTLTGRPSFHRFGMSHAPIILTRCSRDETLSTVLGEKHWIFATLCKWRGERGLPLIITGEESPTAAFMCFLKAIRFAQVRADLS